MSTLGFVTNTASAGAATPLHTAFTGSIRCYANHSVGEDTPQMTSINGSLQNVWFNSVLERWNGSSSSWQPYSMLPTPGTFSHPPITFGLYWYSGAANGYGSQTFNSGQWWYDAYGNPLLNSIGPRYSNLPTGYYRVHEHFEWADGSQANKVLSNGAYCTVT